MKHLRKVVALVKTRCQIFKALKILDSRFRRNDGEANFMTFYRILKKIS